MKLPSPHWLDPPSPKTVFVSSRKHQMILNSEFCEAGIFLSVLVPVESPPARVIDM